MIERKIKTAVMTGPTGAVGMALCDVLLEAGVEVYAVCRPNSPRNDALPQSERLHKVVCDLAQPGALAKALSCPADAFFHLGWSGTTGAARNDMPLQTRNIGAAIEAAQVAAALGCQVFVGAGSQAEYGPVEVPLAADTPCAPQTGYGMAKLCAGQMSRVICQTAGVAHVWARILSVYGPHDGPNSMVSSVLNALLAGQTPALTKGEQQWDYLYAGDAAAALLTMARHGVDGAVYPLGSGEARPLREYLCAMRDALDPALPLGFGEIPYAPGQVMYLRADLNALHRDTGFVPATPFAQGIEQTIDWIRMEKSK